MLGKGFGVVFGFMDAGEGKGHAPALFRLRADLYAPAPRAEFPSSFKSP
jgi:hypothetical protein